MVFLTNNCLVRAQRFVTGTMRYWKKEQIFRFSWHFRNRKKNCYSIGVRYVNRALRYATLWRQLKKIQARELFDQRLDAATGEHNMSRQAFMEGLSRSNIQLDRKVLTDLAIYEPRTFQSLVDVSQEKLKQEGIDGNAPIVPKQDLFLNIQKKHWSKYYKSQK